MIAVPQLDPAATHDPSPHGRRVILECTLLVVLVAAAFLLRLLPLSTARFWDEAVYLQNAEVICCGKVNYSELDSRPPLLSLIFAAVFLRWHHVYAASIATALLNTVGPVLLYLSGRLIAGRIPVAIASLLLAFSPFFVSVFPPGLVSADTGNSLLSDSPALTLLLLSFWLLLRAVRRQTDLGFLCAGFVLALAVLMRFASLSSVGVLSLLVLAAHRWRRAALTCAAGFAGGMGPYLCWSRLRYGGFLTTLRNGWENFQGPGASPLFYVKNFAAVFGWITCAGLVLWIGRWVWENWRQWVGDDRMRRVECAAARRSRRLEAFLWLWAAALGARQTAARLAGALLLVGALTYTFLPVRERFESPFVDDEVSEEMQVTDFLNHNVPPTTVLYSNFNYPVFAYYTNLRVHRLWERGPALYDTLNRLPGDGILIAYKPSDVTLGLRLDWLDSNLHFRRLREFPSLVVYEYCTRAGAGVDRGGTFGEGQSRLCAIRNRR